MTLTAPTGWKESDRRITGEYQQFGMRPVEENELPRGCNGCGFEPPTAFVTAHAPGRFDPSNVLSGEAVTVNTDNDGFFSSSQGAGDAVLAWQYADNAWATVRGRTTITSRRDRMLELARALNPVVRSDVSVPLSIPDVPPSMPLAQIGIDRGQYGTTLIFAGCGMTDIGAVPHCMTQNDSMRVQIWPADDYHGLIAERKSTPIQIGGRGGLYDESGQKAAVKVGPGMIVVFGMSMEPSAAKEILGTVTWAPDPGDEQTWKSVADWVKVG